MQKKLVVLLAFVVAAFFFTGCDTIKGLIGGKSGPKAVAEKFWDATKTGKVSEVKTYITKDGVASLEKENAQDKKIEKLGDYSFGNAKTDGDKATVPTTLKDAEFNVSFDTNLIKEDGNWKVDLDQTMMSMLTSIMSEATKAMGGVENETEKVKDQVLDKEEKKETSEETKVEKNAPAKFALNEEVLVKWKGNWWAAKVIEVGSSNWKIHYDGYDDSWDEWVGPDRIKKK